MRVRAGLVLGGALLLAGTACSSSQPGATPSAAPPVTTPSTSSTSIPPPSPAPTPSASVTPSAPVLPPPTSSTTGTPAISCPSSALPPDPKRPRVELTFTVGNDRRTITGHERVVFTPDLPVTDMVFRLWPNGRGHLFGGSLTVSRARVDGRPVRLVAKSAGGRSGTQGTLLSLPLPGRVAADTVIIADLDFTLALPQAALDRLGSDGQIAWWGTGAPLLAWQSGVGWSRTPGSATPGEMAVSEAADTEVIVVAPAADIVTANGVGAPPVRTSASTRRWRFVNHAARDTVVAVGPLQMITAAVSTSTGTVPVRIAAAPGMGGSAQELISDLGRALAPAVTTFGPYPFPVLNVAILPGLAGTGIEYPGMFLAGAGTGQSIVTHELIHMWFYGMVGNDQELHPWLDEAFATFGEQIVDASLYGAEPQITENLTEIAALPVDSPVSAFEQDFNGYDNVVYYKGAAALMLARARAGASSFDQALRCYVRTNAWTIATGADVAKALTPLPAAVGVLRQAGALR